MKTKLAVILIAFASLGASSATDLSGYSTLVPYPVAVKNRDDAARYADFFRAFGDHDAGAYFAGRASVWQEFVDDVERVTSLK